MEYLYFLQSQAMSVTSVSRIKVVQSPGFQLHGCKAPCVSIDRALTAGLLGTTLGGGSEALIASEGWGEARREHSGFSFYTRIFS